MYLAKYIVKRLLLMVITFFIILTICFVLVKLLPTSPPDIFGKDKELILRRRVLLHQMYYDEATGQYLDTPILEQFIFFLKFAFKGDFGVSEQLFVGRDVWGVFIEKVPYTIAVNLYSIILSIPLGIALGIVAAVKKNTLLDHIISTGVMIVVSVPSFIYGFLVQYLLCFKLGWFEPLFDASNGPFSWTGFSTMLPASLCLSFGSIAGFARYTRAELTEVLTSEFMLLARTKGLTRTQATVRHALRNGMVVIFPMILGEFIGILGGSLILEGMFAIPGVGALYVSSVQSTPPDYNFFILLSSFYLLIGLVAGIISDVSLSIIDPRIRMGAR